MPNILFNLFIYLFNLLAVIMQILVHLAIIGCMGVIIIIVAVIEYFITKRRNKKW